MEKITKKYLSHLFDKLYRMAKEFDIANNPCQIEVDPTGVVCKGMARGYAYGYVTRRDELCCVGCVHLGPKGCKGKALACKLWYCNVKLLVKKPRHSHGKIIIHDKDRGIFRVFVFKNNRHRRIFRKALRYNLIKSRATKTEAVDFAWDIFKNNKPSPFEEIRG